MDSQLRTLWGYSSKKSEAGAIQMVPTVASGVHERYISLGCVECFWYDRAVRRILDVVRWIALWDDRCLKYRVLEYKWMKIRYWLIVRWRGKEGMGVSADVRSGVSPCLFNLGEGEVRCECEVKWSVRMRMRMSVSASASLSVFGRWGDFTTYTTLP